MGAFREINMLVPLHGNLQFVSDGRYKLNRAPKTDEPAFKGLRDGIEGKGMNLENRFKEVYFVPDGFDDQDGFFFVGGSELVKVE